MIHCKLCVNSFLLYFKCAVLPNIVKYNCYFGLVSFHVDFKTMHGAFSQEIVKFKVPTASVDFVCFVVSTCKFNFR